MKIQLCFVAMKQTVTMSLLDVGKTLTSFVSRVNSLCRQAKLVHKRPQLPRRQSAAEHAHSLQRGINTKNKDKHHNRMININKSEPHNYQSIVLD